MKIIRKIYGILPERIKRIIKNYLGKKEKNDVISKQQLLNKLLKFDVISFDIFDTLISRTIFDPDDIFKIMDKKLIDIELKDTVFNMRKNAEKKAKEKLHKDPNIDEIYFELADIYDYDNNTINKIKGLEVELELKFAIPRKDMKDILSQLVMANKKVVLTSDMYLNKYIIEKMLYKCGYEKEKHYHKIYLSNEKNKRKDDESMWKYLRVLYSGIKFIHVGDNINSDYYIPTKLGINAINILNSREQLRRTEYYKRIKDFIEERSVSDSMYLGYIINEIIFNSPFTFSIASFEDLSKSYIAPILYEFIKFVDDNTNEKDKLLFLSREGYYLEKIYDDYVSIFKKAKKDHFYFLASRRATTSATITSEKDVMDSINREYYGTIKDFLNGAYGIIYNDNDFNIKLPEDIEQVKPIIKEYSKDILEISEKNKKAYIKYINSIINIKNDNCIIVDLGYSGTIQYHLSKMLNKDFTGLYLTNSKTVKKYNDKSQLLFAFDINNDAIYEKIYHYSLILEFFLSAPYGQLQYFEINNNTINPIYNDDIMDDHKKEKIEEIYKYVKEYMVKLSELNNILPLEINKKLICSSNTAIVETNFISRNIKDEFIFMDSFNNSEPKNVFKIISRY